MWPNTENSIVIDFCTLLVLCLVGYVLMSQSTSSRSSKKDKKKKRQQQQQQKRLLIRLILGPDLLLKWQRKPGMF